MKKIKRHLVILLLLITGLTISAQSIEEARKWMSYGQYPRAIQILESLTKTNPTNVQYFLWLGDAYSANGNADKSMEAWRAASTANPTDNYALIASGRVQLAGNPTEAQKFFEKAIKNTKSKDAKILQTVGQSYLYAKQKDLDMAIEYLNKAISVDRSDPSIFMSLAEAYMAKRDAGSAMTNYEYAVEKSTNKAEAYFKIGDVYLKAKNFELAEKYLMNARQADPNFPETYKLLGNYYYESAFDFSKAVENYEKYNSMVNPNNDDLARFANALYANKQYDRSINVIKDILKSDPSATYLFKVVAQSYNQSGNLAEALEYMFKYLGNTKADKQEAADYIILGDIYNKQGADSIAMVNYLKAYNIDNKQTDMLDTLIGYYNSQKNYQEAAKYYILKTKSPVASLMDYFGLGRSYYLMKDYPNADIAFSQIITLKPDAATGYLWSAKCKAKLDVELITGAALPVYEKFIEVALPNADTYKKELGNAYVYLAYYQLSKINDYSKAKEYAQLAITIDPDNPEATEMLKQLP